MALHTSKPLVLQNIVGKTVEFKKEEAGRRSPAKEDQEASDRWTELFYLLRCWRKEGTVGED